jgi:hypothetical protein
MESNGLFTRGVRVGDEAVPDGGGGGPGNVRRNAGQLGRVSEVDD